jgi:uncharacterized protein YjiS (DUF1127 family)
MRQAQMTLGTRRSQYYRTHRASGPSPLGTLTGLFETLQQWLELWQQRRALSLLDDRMLKDVGLNKIDVDREMQKPFWQI